ncbi:MAG: exosortase/archaeosortase family protein [Deltaproteobacteria bacterium]|nr:exosortase/archaeosortase family protein [Deltaproteobacteria bacterium]
MATDSEVTGAARDRGRQWLLAIVGLLFVAIYAPTVQWLWGRWTMSVWHNVHGMFIPLIVTYLVWQELKRLRSLPASSSPWGFVFLIPALILHTLDTGLNTQLLSAASIVLAMPGLSLLFLGPARTQPIMLPLLFLALMLPIPLVMTEPLHLALRHISARAAAGIVPFFGIPIYLEQTTLHTVKAQVAVVDACSGFSTLYASVATACLIAYIGLNWRWGSLVIIAAAPIAIAANIARVVLLVLLVQWQGAEVVETPLHPLSGILTFGLALPAIFWLGQYGGRRR